VQAVGGRRRGHAVFLINDFPIASGRHYPIFRPSEKGISGVFGKGAV
jgi:hypothetical protein